MVFKSRTPTAEERRFMTELCSRGCCVCRKFYGVYTEASPHHMDGKTKPGAHLHILPLCSRHHQVSDTQKPKRWYSRHGDSKTEFEKAYGSEMYLYHYALELLNK